VKGEIQTRNLSLAYNLLYQYTTTYFEKSNVGSSYNIHFLLLQMIALQVTYVIDYSDLIHCLTLSASVALIL
jgi:hypothetical protein